MSNSYQSMKIKVLNVNKYVKENHLIPVTSSKKIDINNTLHKDGLFSEQIFGRIGSKERMTKMSYINLNCKCIQPYLCIALERSSADFSNTILGKLRWKIDGGKLSKSDNLEDPSGLSFIYENWEIFIKEILKSNGSKSREQTLDLIKKYKKDDLFTDKWLVIPAGFRDINTIDIEKSGKSDYDQINDFYSAIILLSNQLDNITDIKTSLVDEKFSYQIQQNINEIYRRLMEIKTAKKGGLIQKAALAKTIMYSAGNVICIPKLTREHYNIKDSTNIQFGHIGVPTVQLLDIFYPFINHRIKEMFSYKEELYEIVKYLIKAKDTYSENDVVEKFINKSKNDNKFVFKNMEFNDKKYSITINGREKILNVLEFLKNEIVDPIIMDKFVTATRFPVDNKLSQQYLKPIATTVESVEKVEADDGIEYELCKNNILILAFQVNINTLGPMGGDFDGDAIALIGIFSDEANKAIEETGWLCKFPLTTTNKPITENKNEVLYGLYLLTE